MWAVGDMRRRWPSVSRGFGQDHDGPLHTSSYEAGGSRAHDDESAHAACHVVRPAPSRKREVLHHRVPRRVTGQLTSNR